MIGDWLESYPKTSGINLPVDLIRTVAIFLVILLHAAIEPNLTVDFMSPQGVELWWTATAYKSIAVTCIPLFVILTGALLLQPAKTNEPLGVFFRKRWRRIGIPTIFWGIIYFGWSFFVRDQPVTSDAIFKGILTGPYYHFWFLYLLIGLYLLTPLIRILVSYADWKIIKYFLIIWLIGTGIIPLIGLYTNISPAVNWFQQSVFLLTGLIGYFILGAYIKKLRFRRSTLTVLMFLGAGTTALGTYVLVATIGEFYGIVLFDASSLSVIATSIALFLLLAAVPNQTVEKHTKNSRVLRVVSENTLPIYLLHVIVLETLQSGYLGFSLNVSTLNPILEIPLITALTLMICLAIIVPLKKLPYIKRLIG